MKSVNLVLVSLLAMGAFPSAGCIFVSDSNSDKDNDGFDDSIDNCPNVANPGQTDVDGDHVGDLCDNCPTTANTNQANADGDALGDACDTPAVDNAVFNTAWMLTNGAGATTCANVGANKTSYLFTGTDNMGHEDLFTCSDMGGDTAPVPLDNYTYVVTLLNCHDAQPGCPNFDNIKMSDPQTVNTNSCDTITGSTCHIDLPIFNFNF